MTRVPQDTSAEEPDGGNLQVRLRRGPGSGDRPGLLNIRFGGDELPVYLYRDPVDMRKGRNCLAALAQEAMKVDPFLCDEPSYVPPLDDLS